MLTTEEAKEVLLTFLQYGYKKSSLDTIAKRLGVSRQTLYLKYKSKEKLFQMAMHSYFEDKLQKAKTLSLQTFESLEEKILVMFVEVYCENFTLFKSSEHVAEIMNVSHKLVGDILQNMHTNFIKLLQELLKEHLIKQELCLEQMAQTLYFSHKGIMLLAQDLEEYKTKMRHSICIICRP